MRSLTELRALLILIGMMTAFGLGVHLRSVGDFSLAVAGFWAASLLGCWLTGKALERQLRLGIRSVPVKILAGGIILGVLGSLIKLAVPWRLDAILVALVAASATVVWRSAPQRADDLPRPVESWYALAATLVGALAAIFWTWHLQPQVGMVDGGLIYRPFREYLCLGSLAGELAIEGSPWRVGRLHFAGEPLPLYHYASFCLPVLASQWTRTPLWQAMEACWHPFSLVWLGWGAYALGHTISGPRGGFLATLGVMALPDLFFWPGAPQVTMLSFHRYIEGSPGLAYGCGAVALATSVLLRGLRHGCVRQVFGGCAFLMASFWFKFNAFLPAFGLFGLALVVAGRRVKPSVRWGLVAAWGLLVAVGAVGMMLSHNAPTLLPGGDAGQSLFQAIEESGVVPVGIMQREAQISGLIGLARRLLWFVGIVFGPLLVPFVAETWWGSGRFCHPSRGAWLPLVALGIILASAFGTSPNRNGDPFEMNHRQFGWAYTAVACWSFALGARRALKLSRHRLAGDAASAAFLLGWIVWVAFRGNLPTDRLTVADGLIDCCRFLRTAARPDDAVVDSAGDPFWLVVSQAQRPVYVSYPPSESFNGWQRMRQMIVQRRAEIQQALTLQSTMELWTWMRQRGLRWFLVLPDAQPAWPAEVLDFPTFRAGGCRVYDLELLPEPPDA